MVSLAMKQLAVNLDRAVDVDGMVAAFGKFEHELSGRLLLDDKLKPIRQALLGVLDLCEDLAIAWKDIVNHICKHTTKPTSRHFAIQQSRRQGPEADDTAYLSPDEDEILGSDPSDRPVSSVSSLLKEYERQLSFALAGLRSVSRVEGEPAWIMLSEKLQWGSASLDRR